VRSTYSIEVRDGGMHLKDQSDDVLAKIVQVPDELGKALAHLSLHSIDLQFATECLDELDRLGYPRNGGDITCQALWHSALVATYKCFGNSNARSSLKRDVIYTDAAQRDTFNYWRNLRNKNIVHDENDVTQSHVVAVLRRREYAPKIDNMYVISLVGLTVCAENSAKLRGLVDTAREWVRAETDKLRQEVMAELNAMTYEDVDALPPVNIPDSTNESVGRTRISPPK
jgi:hypothetical protein